MFRRNPDESHVYHNYCPLHSRNPGEEHQYHQYCPEHSRNPLPVVLCECGEIAECGCGRCQDHCQCEEEYQSNPGLLTRNEYFALHRLETSRSFTQQLLRGDHGPVEQERHGLMYAKLQHQGLISGFDLADPWTSSFNIQLTRAGLKTLSRYRERLQPTSYQANPNKGKSACEIYFGC